MFVTSATIGGERLDRAVVALAADPWATPLRWPLALGAGRRGNGSLVGASANGNAVGTAERRGGEIGFWGFTQAGPPFAAASLVVASLRAWVRFFVL